MRVTQLLICAELENVTSLTVGDDFDFAMKLKCTSCDSETEKEHIFSLSQKMSGQTERSEVNHCYKCKLCGRVNTVVILGNSIRQYEQDDSGQYRPLVELDCRGCEPVSFEPGQSRFEAASVNSSRKWNQIDLSDGNWADYDEENRESVGVYDFAYKFEYNVRK